MSELRTFAFWNANASETESARPFALPHVRIEEKAGRASDAPASETKVKHILVGFLLRSNSADPNLNGFLRDFNEFV